MKPCAPCWRIKSAKVSLEIVGIDVGIVTKNDVLMAGAAGSVIVGFHTKLENGVTSLAKHHGVRVETYEIIYEMGDKVREMMADLLDPDLKETKTGAAEVRQVFPLAKGLWRAASSPRAKSTATRPRVCVAVAKSSTRAR